jgi:hypothetical protein
LNVLNVEMSDTSKIKVTRSSTACIPLDRQCST